MSIRSFLFEQILHAAHRSMKLGPMFPVSRLPRCYDIEHYDQNAIKGLGRRHIVVGPSQFIFWADEGERLTSWESWTVSDVDTFILRFYRRNLYDEFAPYPLILTAAIYGQLTDPNWIGRSREWNDKKYHVRDSLVGLLDKHLDSVSHVALKRLLSWLV